MKTCPECGAAQHGEVDGKRIWFACESYGGIDDGKIRHQSDLCAAWQQLNEQNAIAQELGALATRHHYSCEEDTWYACPKSTTGCADEAQGTECNCGADAHNEKVSRLLARLKDLS